MKYKQCVFAVIFDNKSKKNMNNVDSACRYILEDAGLGPWSP